MTNKIHVMHILPNLEVGGMENGVVNLANHINREKFCLSICCLNSEGPLRERLGKETRVFNMRQNEGKAFFLPFKLSKLLKKEEVDIVHTHNDYAGIYGVMGGKLAHVPAIVHGEHGLTKYTHSYRRFIKKLICYLSTRITTVSEGLKRDVQECWGVRKDKISVLLNGVDTEKYSVYRLSTQTRREIVDDDGSIIIGTVGRLHDQKNYPLLLEAFSHVVKQITCTKLVFVGNGPLRKDLENIVRHLKIDKYVVFLGERKDVPSLLKAMDIFVLPSYTGEGIANCILEAMATGLPVVASDIKGNIEIIEDQKTGFLFPSKELFRLVEKINKLIEDPILRKRMGTMGRERVEKYFSLKKMISNYEGFYAQLLSQKNKIRQYPNEVHK